jgi:transposase-like protein
MAKSQDKTKERYWRRLLRERGDSGKSVSEFCRQRRIPISQYYWWRRQLGRRDAGASSPDNHHFIPIRVPAHLPTIEIVHPGGCVLRISSAVDAQTLRCVLDALNPTEA